MARPRGVSRWRDRWFEALPLHRRVRLSREVKRRGREARLFARVCGPWEVVRSAETGIGQRSGAYRSGWRRVGRRGRSRNNAGATSPPLSPPRRPSVLLSRGGLAPLHSVYIDRCSGFKDGHLLWNLVLRYDKPLMVFYRGWGDMLRLAPTLRPPC